MSGPETKTAAAPGEIRKREPLSHQELIDLVAAFGNHEAKALVLGLMQPDTIYFPIDASRMIRGAQGSFRAWGMSSRGPFNYMGQSFDPIGLVAKKVETNDGLQTTGFIKTEKGRTLGDSFAGLLLDFSLRYPKYSLIDLFASTNTKQTVTEDGVSKKRAPSTNIKLFWELATTKLPTTASRLMEAIGEPDISLVTIHLEGLSEKGIVIYNAAPYGAPQVFYQIKEGHPQEKPSQYQYQRSLSAFVYAVILTDPQKKWTGEEISTLYMKKEGKSDISFAGVKTRVLNILKFLSSEGYLQSFEFAEDKSKVSISDQQRVMLLDLVSILDRFQSQDANTLSWGKMRLAQIISDPRSVAILMKKAREHSPSANKVGKDLSTAEIRNIVSSNPSITVDGIRERLATFQQRRIGKGAIRGLIKMLVDDGIIIVDDKNANRHFSLRTN